MDTKSTTADEFTRALGYALAARDDHNGDAVGAFREIVGEPDIIAHWESLGAGAVTDMVGHAAQAAKIAYDHQAGGILDFLPIELRVHSEYGPLVEIARTLVRTLDHEGTAALYDEAARTLADLDTADAVGVFAALALTVHPPTVPAPGDAPTLED